MLKRNPSLIKLSLIVSVYFSQNKLDFLHSLLKRYSKYSEDVLASLQIIIVDDGSPTPITIPENLNMNILLLRIEDDIQWNQAGGRNLGVAYAKSDKILLTDLDHEFPEQTLRHLINKSNPTRKIYKFNRVGNNGKRMSSGANIFYLSRSRFLKYNGYDEEFCGHYGFEDTWFYKWQRFHGSMSKYLNSKYFVKLRIDDCSQNEHTLVRDASFNKIVFERKKEENKKYGGDFGHSKTFLNFKWKIEKDLYRDCQNVQITENRWWLRLWYLRWPFGDNGIFG